MKITLLGETRDPKQYRSIHIKYDNGKSFLIENGLRVSSIHVRPMSSEANISNLARIADAELALEDESVSYMVVRGLRLPNRLKKAISDYLTRIEQRDSVDIYTAINLNKTLRSFMFNGS